MKHWRKVVAALVFANVLAFACGGQIDPNAGAGAYASSAANGSAADGSPAQGSSSQGSSSSSTSSSQPATDGGVVESDGGITTFYEAGGKDARPDGYPDVECTAVPGNWPTPPQWCSCKPEFVADFAEKECQPTCPQGIDGAPPPDANDDCNRRRAWVLSELYQADGTGISCSIGCLELAPPENGCSYTGYVMPPPECTCDRTSMAELAKNCKAGWDLPPLPDGGCTLRCFVE